MPKSEKSTAGDMKMEYVKGMVSVVIPTHNRESLICRAVDSALSQTYGNIEVIVVSDGSEDGTDKLMQEYEKKYPNFRYISYHPGKGGNVARNTGIKNSKGEFVAFLDDDDEWHKDKIEKQIRIIEEDPEVGLVCTAINSVDDATGKTAVFVPDAPRDASHNILIENCIGSTTTALARHSLLDEIGMFDENLGAMQDFDLWIRLCQITKTGVVREPCVEYHNLVSNSQISWNYQKYENAATYMAKKYEELRKQKLTSSEIKTVRLNDILNLARKAFKSNDRRTTRRLALKALKVKFNVSSIIYIAASFFPVDTVRKIRRRMKF